MRSFHKPVRAAPVSGRARRLRPLLERLEPRLALSASDSTDPAGSTIGQSLGAVVNTHTLDSIQVASVSGIDAAPAYLLLTQAGQQAPYALVSYGTKTDTASTRSFTNLALPVENGNVIFQRTSSAPGSSAFSGPRASAAAVPRS